MDEDSANLYEGRERELLAAALKASGLSARQAAAKMDISDTRLRHIINGYQPVGRGRTIAVMGPADTVARIAQVLGVTPDRLRSAGRPDAADELASRTAERQRFGGVDDSFSIVQAISDWAEDPVNLLPPDDALRFYEDGALLGEIQRRITAMRDYIDDPSSTSWADFGAEPNVFNNHLKSGGEHGGDTAATSNVTSLSEVPDTVEPVAASKDDDMGKREREVEEPDTP